MNIIIVVYYWPPSAGSGVQRWLKMTKYLQDMDVNVYVYTPSNPDYNLRDETLLDDVHPEINVIKKHIWEPYKLARLFGGNKVSNTGVDQAKKNDGLLGNLIQYIRARFFVPDPRIFWVNPSVRFLRDFISREKIDCIITSGPPHSLHKIGYKLNRKLSQLRWIMDVRDPISQMDFFEDMGVKGSLRKRYIDYEKKMIHNADAVVGTSYSLPRYLVDFNEEKYHTIPNGYDEEDFKSVNGSPGNNKVLISHAGVFNHYRFSSSLWKAFAQIRDKLTKVGKELEVQLAGPINTEILEKARTISGLGDNLVNRGYINHDEVLKLYEKSSVLLLLANNSEMGTTTVPGKIFELMASGKAVLGMGDPEGDASRILRKSRCGKIFSYSADPEIVSKWIMEAVDKENSDRNKEYIEQFTRRNLALKYKKLCTSLRNR